MESPYATTRNVWVAPVRVTVHDEFCAIVVAPASTAVNITTAKRAPRRTLDVMRCSIFSSVLVRVLRGSRVYRRADHACTGGGCQPHPSGGGFPLRLSGERPRMTLTRVRVERHESGAQGVQRQLDAITHPELPEHVAEMRFHGFLADEELPGDVAVLAPHRDVAHDLELARRETLAVGLAHAAGEAR